MITVGKAYYLCDNGARDGRDIRGALFQYNHADWYGNDVLARAARYVNAQANEVHPGQWTPS